MIGAIRAHQPCSSCTLELYLFGHNKPAIKVFLTNVFRLFIHGNIILHCKILHCECALMLEVGKR